MGRFDREKYIKAASAQGGKGQKLRSVQKHGVCSTCHCSPCSNSEDCRKARGQSSYNARKKAPPSKPKSKSKGKSKKKGGLCSVVALLLLGTFGSGVYGLIELSRWVVG